MKPYIVKDQFTFDTVLERILRAYEKGDISTNRTKELINQLYLGRTHWVLETIWATVLRVGEKSWSKLS